MKRRSGLLMALMLLPVALLAQTTLEDCQRAAVQNYPLIRKYALLEQTTAVSIDQISKAWLPQVSASAQATWQNRVVALPEVLGSVMQQMGNTPVGLRKDQYRVGIDVQQVVYDGGAVRQQQAVAREQGAVESAQNAVDIYAVHKRVNELFFSLLLTEGQVSLNSDLQAVLSQNEAKLASMLRHGTAAESDYNTVRAELLEAMQQGVQLRAMQSSLRRLLELFCCMSVGELVKPEPVTAPGTVSRPELRLLDARLRLADAQEKSLSAGLLPRVSLFASGYYGYPGYDMFHDIMSHDWTFNGIIGTRVSWNLGAFYTHKNDRRKLALARQQTENQRELFLFNTHLEQVQEQEDVSRYRRMAADDEEIIRLRTAVRQSAESKLAHGIIDVSELVRQIQQENAAKTQQRIHEIEMLRAMYQLRYTMDD